ncbi:MAG: alpha amylase N-terminal ig-like domain-containing protein [Lachnospiraceae bacterium]|nr:alpha amylase N-terminal ig-like domain-containing protein [Candidatus Equihabitans merdae]
MSLNWKDSVYSDGTEYFVSNPQPVLGEMVKISLRLLKTAPVQHVLLRFERNGLEEYSEMQMVGVEQGLAYFTTELRMTEPRIRYRFVLTDANHIWHYNQRGITENTPDINYDFTLLTDYRQPTWVKEAVFYQIFPERFANGCPENDVKDGELSHDGHPSIHMNWQDRPLMYEDGYCMDFFGGDLDGIREKIPYFKKLGVTALYLNPIFKAPSIHKYDCIDYFHVDPHFGGDEALARLSEALHENDMKLMLDISINHTGTDHRWFNRDGKYFDKSVGAYNNPDSKERGFYYFDEEGNYTPWCGVMSMPELNYTSDALRQMIYRAEDSVIKKWLKPPYSIDGWRFDVADVFARNDEVQLSHEVWPEIRQSIRKENAEAYILAEDWGDCSQYLQGDEWDSPMNYYGCCRIIRMFYGGKDLYTRHQSIINGVDLITDAEQVRCRVEQFLAKLPYVVAQNQFNLLDSHDVPRIAQMEHMKSMTGCGDVSGSVNQKEASGAGVSAEASDPAPYLSARTRGAVIFMFMLPGAANIYYGDEAEIDGWTETMEGCRFPMPWDKDIESTESYGFYHDLCHLKQTTPALSHGGMKFLYAKGNVMAISRFDADDAYVAVISKGPEETIQLPLGLIGARCPEGELDLFGQALDYQVNVEGIISLKVKEDGAYLFKCCME